MKPVDPRLLPHLAPARVPLAGAVLGGTVAGALVVAQAFAVAWLVTALLDRDAAGSGRAAESDLGDLGAEIERAVDAIEDLAADRLLRAYLEVIAGTVRTNAFQPGFDP
ncbi:MAG: hypothetical protein ACLGH5_09710, partial [Actinomycetes bacterium]